MLLIHTSCGPLVDLDHLFRNRVNEQNEPGEGNGELRTPNISWPVVRAATWQHGLYEIWLPEGFTWEVPDTEFARGEAYSMVYTPVDTINYRVLRQDITVNRIDNSTTDFGNSVEGEMVWIPAGTFTMGSDGNEWHAQPAHQVILTQGFFMGTTEVTQAQWRTVMEGNVNEIRTEPSWFRQGGNGAALVSGQDTSNFPVEQVSWYDILVFANTLSIARGLRPAYEMETTTAGVWSTDPNFWGTTSTIDDRTRWDAVRIVANSYGYRLPTEAQLEYATRAGTDMQWSFGDTANFDYMWIEENSQSRTHEVGTGRANPWGLYDMHGNVWERVWDRWGSYDDLLELESEPRVDPTGPDVGIDRIRRGGSWSDDAFHARSSIRFRSEPTSNWRTYGFRLVRPYN